MTKRLRLSGNPDGIERWLKHCRLTDEAAHEWLCCRLPPCSADFHVHFESADQAVMSIQLVEALGWKHLLRNPRSIAAGTRYLDFGRAEITHERLVVTAGWRGKGYGTTLVMNQLPFWQAMGFERVNAISGKESGGYNWARLGFACVPGDYEPLRRHVIKGLYAKRVIQHLGFRKVAALEKVLTPWDERSLGLVANLEQKLPSGEKLAYWLLLRSNWRGCFDLAEGSASWKAYNAHRRQRGLNEHQ